MHVFRRSMLLPVVLCLGLMLIVGCSKDDSPSGPKPPLCEIAYPRNGQAVTDTVMVEIRAEDNNAVAEVLLYIDNALVYQTRISPYQYRWNTRLLADSSFHKLYAKAWNQDSLSAVSDTVEVMINYAAGVGQNVLIIAKQGQGEGTLSLIDIYAGGMMERDVIGTGRFPNDIIFYNGRLYVVNSGSNDMNVIRLTYSGEMSADGDVISLGSHMPQYAALSDSGYIYISNGNTNDVTVFDPDLKVAINYPAVGTYPADVLALGNKIYVCNSGYDTELDSFLVGSVTVIDGYLNRRITDIEIGARKNPQFMALAPDGMIHVVCTGDYWRGMPGEVQVIDPTINSVVRYIYIGGNPGEIAITSDGYGYIAAGGWGGEPGQIYRYNTATGQILNGPDDNAVNDPIRVESGAMRIVAGSDKSVYVACFEGGTVDKIIGGIRVESYPVGPSAAPMIIIER